MGAVVFSQVGVQEASVTEEAALPMTQPKMRGLKHLSPTYGCPTAAMSRMKTVGKAVIKLGADSGGLVFSPDSITVKTGETVTFTNNAGFLHNVVFDEDAVPDGVNAEALSR